MMGPRMTCLLGLIALIGVGAVPLSMTDVAPDMVGYSKLEAELMSMAKIGKFELAFDFNDVREIVASIHPFHRYEEAKENVVLMDEFPYVPVVKLAQFNVSIILSNLVLRENFDPALTKIEFEPGWQSLFFVDIPLNATFDWRVNGTDIVGKANMQIPHSWIHQNVETGCAREQTSLLAWEGRVDVYPTDVDIVTTCDNKPMMDDFAEHLHTDRIVHTYIANAMQHQMASFIGNIHWKLQSRMRDLCLTCVSARSNNSTFIVRLGADMKCLNSIPPFLWERVANTAEPLAKLQSTFKDRLIDALLPAFAPARQSLDERLELMTLPSIKTGVRADIDQLRPKHDPREKYKKSQAPSGFIMDKPVQSQWRQRLGQWYMNFMGKPEVTVTNSASKPQEAK